MTVEPVSQEPDYRVLGSTPPQGAIDSSKGLASIDGAETINGQLCRIASRLLEREVMACEFPAGKHRQVVRAIFEDGSSAIIARRKSSNRAELEIGVLSTLNGTNAPKVLASNGIVVVQEDVGSTRLSEMLIANNNQSTGSDIMFGGLSALANIHDCAQNAQLGSRVPILGADDDWLRVLIDRPAVIGSHLDYHAPEPKIDEIFELLTVCDPQFVKWDARPANAIQRADGGVSWIDWEHCGARNALDDIVWFMCDETVPEDMDRDLALLAEFTPSFAPQWNRDHAQDYCFVMGTFHFCVRLSLIIDRQEKYGWDDAEKCAGSDKIGSSLGQAETVCRRAAHWAAMSGKTDILSAWFADLAEVFNQAA